MKIFLDTANIEEIEKGARMGVVAGVTTNPSLLAKAGHKDYEAAVKKICSIIPGPVSAEVTVEGKDEMLTQARSIATWAPNVIIKIPATLEGLEVTRALATDGIKVNMTLCFSVNQAILGVAAGASYISPFVGRVDDIGNDGMALIRDMVQVFDNYQFEAEIITASIRHPQHCVEAALAGAHIATVPFKVLEQMMDHPLTDAGIAKFMEDWKKVRQQK